MAKQWIKLYIEILDDPKMGKMPDWLFRRAIELFLLAGRNGNDGVLPPVEDMAWILRLDETKLSEALHGLAEVGVVHEAEPGVWMVTHFEERQDADTSAERVRSHRARDDVTKRYKNVTEDVTNRYKNVTGGVTKNYREEEDKEEDKDKEERREETRASPLATAAAISEAQALPEEAVAERIYLGVTGYTGIPPSIRSPATEIILSLRARFPDQEAMIAYLRPFFDAWRQRRAKNGRFYSPLSAGWLEWALAGEIPGQKPRNSKREPTPEELLALLEEYPEGAMDGKT